MPVQWRCTYDRCLTTATNYMHTITTNRLKLSRSEGGRERVRGKGKKTGSEEKEVEVERMGG